MASTQNKQKVSDMVFDVKQKLTDEEYKNIMDGIKKINEKKYVKIRYMVFEISRRDFDDDDLEFQLVSNKHTTICEVKDEHPFCIYLNIHRECVLEKHILDTWNKVKDEKTYWPLKYQPDTQNSIVICDFEEL